ncbi:MAG: glycosyltransferase family 9 protein [Magnetococcales bacterium]|nr:glycosyltransferase family 9 protein [Magnetococcales bacterium]
MTIKWLRLLDYWIGRALCTIVTGLLWIRRLFPTKGAELAHPRSILLIKLFGIGSIVLSLPAIQTLRQHHPQATLHFLTFRSNAQLLPLTGMVAPENMLTIDNSSAVRLLRSGLHALLQARRLHLDAVVDLEFFSRFTALFGRMARPGALIGFHGFHTEGLKRGNLLDYSIHFNSTLHTSRVFMTLLQPFGIASESAPKALPRLPPAPHFRENIAEWLRQAGCQTPAMIRHWIAINPHCGDLVLLRKWPITHFQRLLTLLLEGRADIGIVIIGSAHEYQAGETLRQLFASTPLQERLFNLAGKTDVQGLIDLFHWADCLISNDSGPAHVAALTGIPSIVLFGPESATLYRPLGAQVRALQLDLDCQPCLTIFNGKHSHCTDNRCLMELLPEVVAQEVWPILAHKEHRA